MSKSDISSRSSSTEFSKEANAESGEDNSITEEAEEQDSLPSSPPPPYERVLEEDEANDREKASEKATTPVSGPVIFHRSTKELYKAVAKQFGITCKMSDHCRCLDCQSHYFDCEYEQSEDDKTDFGLGAGTPMFISEVVHGTACSLL